MRRAVTSASIALLSLTVTTRSAHSAPSDETDVCQGTKRSALLRPARLAADATRGELIELVEKAHNLDAHEAARLFLRLIELGDDADPRVLNEVRIEVWNLLSTSHATKAQLASLLERLRGADASAHEALTAQVATASSARTLDEIRARALTRLLDASSGTPKLASASEGCADIDEEVGYLTIDTTPWSEVTINGEYYGQTPLARISLLTGCVTVRAVNSEGEIFRSLKIRPNRNAVLKADLSSGHATITNY